MLILTRRKNETIRIGDDITIYVLENNNQHVSIGIQAPRDIPVHRDEVYKRICLEREEAKVVTADEDRS